MRLTAKLAYSQLKTNRKRALWTLAGIILSTAMITAVYGFAASGMTAMYEMSGGLRDVYVATITGIGVVLSVIIVTASVIVISNSFRVSAGERLSQFGMLKSVGATKRQIAEIIMYESIFLSIAGIPIGVAVGLLTQFAGIEIANFFISDINEAHAHVSITFGFVIAWQAILVSVAVGFGTVLLSAWLPARKAAKITAINAIKKVGDVVVKQKHVRSNWIVRKLFGFEGALASKSLKRSRRNLRATVVSLSISIVLFVAASSFGAQLNRLAAVVFHLTDADVVGEYTSTMRIVMREGEMREYYYAINNELAEQITASLREFPGANVIGAGSNTSSFRMTSTAIPVGMLTAPMRDRYVIYHAAEQINLSISLVTVDAQTYAELTRLAGVPYGSNILVNYYRAQIDGRWTEFTPFVFDEQIITLRWLINRQIPEIFDLSENEYTEIPLHGELRYDQVPREVLHISRGAITIIVPELDAKSYNWYAQTNDPSGFTAFMHEIFDEKLPRSESDVHLRIGIRNLAAEQASERAIIRLVMIFTYGFVGMLTLIGLTNVISTISTNVRSRAREFAVLQSVGMTGSGLNKMLNLESILCSLKSLVIGLPLGVLASFFIYQAILESVHFSYEFPFVTVAQCILAVFILTWSIMRYSVVRLRGNNIVDTIRGIE